MKLQKIEITYLEFGETLLRNQKFGKLSNDISIKYINQGCIHRGDRCDWGRTFRYLNPIPTRGGGRFCPPSHRSQLNFPCGYVPGNDRETT